MPHMKTPVTLSTRLAGSNLAAGRYHHKQPSNNWCLKSKTRSPTTEDNTTARTLTRQKSAKNGRTIIKAEKRILRTAACNEFRLRPLPQARLWHGE
jgi:hypothetical protein